MYTSIVIALVLYYSINMYVIIMLERTEKSLNRESFCVLAGKLISTIVFVVVIAVFARCCHRCLCCCWSLGGGTWPQRRKATAINMHT